MNDLEKGVRHIHAGMIAAQGGGEIKTKPVHVHLEHPVAQTVHHQLKRVRMQQVERVPGPGEIHVQTRVFRMQPVIRDIVDATETKRRPEMISFRGVIVDDVEDDFDAGGVETAHHRFELGHLSAKCAVA